MSDDTAPNEQELDGVRPRVRPSGLRDRVFLQRWVLAVAAVLATTAVLVADVPAAYAISGFVLLAGVAVAGPRQRPLIGRRIKRHKLESPWPETGMKQVADAFPDACFVVDRRGITRYANAAARDRFGQVFPGDPISFRLRSPALLEALDRVIEGEPAQRIEWSEKGQTEQWLEAHIAPVAGTSPDIVDAAPDAGTMRFVLVTVQDQTDQRRLERMRADFVANASHELRTPLASLTGFVETLMGPAKDDPVARDRFLAIMMQQGERMRRLIDDLLSLSRVELKAHVQPESIVELKEIVRHTCDALKPVANDVGVTVDLVLPEHDCLVRGDRDEMIEVLENLVDNSLKYGASGERITIEVGYAEMDRAQAEPQPAGHWLVSVRDHGPGIAPEHLPRLTERFYRVDVAASREMKGTGLGLAIVKHILTRHRARLEIESNPGEGATFTVRIPVVQAPVASNQV